MRVELDRTRRRRPRLGDRRAAELVRLGELGTRFRDDPRSPESRSTGEQRILVVDDESAIRLLCRVNLDPAGFETIEAGNGATALALARSERPDLILLDVMLPGLDGWEVAQKLAEMPETRSIPIVLLPPARRRQTRCRRTLLAESATSRSRSTPWSSCRR
jgi:CheY-like chemotaxis protein